MKKLVSIIMTCIMIIGMCSTVFATGTEETTDVTLFDFSDHSRTYGNLVNTTERANSGKTGSAKLSLVKGLNGTLRFDTMDWSAYKTLKITMASKYAYPSQMNVLVHFDGLDGYAQTRIPITQKEFTTILIPIENFTLNKDCDWTKAADIQLYFEGWGITEASIDSAAEYYFDEIALSADEAGSAGELPYTDITNTNELVVSELGNTSLKSCTGDSDLTLFGNKTAKWNTTGSGSQVVISKAMNVSSYDNLYLTLYNGGTTTDSIGVHIKDAKGGQTTYALKVDWSGWKTVAIPVSKYKDRDLTAVTSVELWDYGWTYHYGENNESLNIGRIWFGKDNTGYAVIDNTEKAVGFNTYSDLNLTGVESLSFDLYSSMEAAGYATGVVLKDGGNHAKPIEMNFSGWKNFTFSVADFGLSSLENVTLYIATNWGIPGYDKASECDGLTVKVRNIKKVLSKEAASLIYTSSDKTDSECYYVFNKRIGSVDGVSLSVTDTATSQPVASSIVWVENKIYAEFDKIGGRSYTVTLSGVTDEPITNTFTYAGAGATEPEVTVTDFAVEKGVLTVTDTAAAVKYNYQNGSGAAKTASIIIAIYNADGSLSDTKIVNFKNLLSGRRGELVAEITGNYQALKVKAFAFSSMSNLSPLTEATEN